jgi:predicted ATPase/class 3 adenylate cyclase
MANMRSTPFGELLRHARQAARLTQAELAERAGLSVRGINDLERGVRQTPRRDTVTLLAQALDLTGEERTAFQAAARLGRGQQSAKTTGLPLPSGTVTFLFTDIEGSTRLLQQLGATRYATLRDTHARLLQAACAAHGGHEADTQGDSFFFAFPTAGEAVAAAAQAQHAIALQSWPAGVPVRVRMGLHTGAPMVAGEHYVGLDVHRAARIGAAGHGGQVLLSQTTRDLALDALPEGPQLRDLGVHRLKDLQRPEHVWQLVLPDVPGLAVDFPPLDTLDAHSYNLPIQPTPLVGREREIAAVCALLQREDVRLLTLTGTGGIGKTRLALQVAAELCDAFADGVWFVGLSRLVDPALVLPTIAQTLGVREAGGQPMAVTLAGYLHTKHVLFVLDNFEQVAVAATELAELLETCARLKVLVTSRVALHLRGEKQYRVTPLSLPDPDHLPPPPQDLVQVPAVALFVQRAQDADATFALSNAAVLAIAGICVRLDGLPLAIELAAVKVRVLPPPALLMRLERQLPLLTGGARDLEARQQTMRNTLAWSEDLLSPEQQRLFRRLAVFVGGWTLEAAETVCVEPEGAPALGIDILEGLGTLLDQSLAERRESAGELRYGMLNVIREYAREQLVASGEVDAIRRAHAAYFLALAEEGQPHLLSNDQARWLNQLEREHSNLRATLAWACEQGASEMGLRLGAVLSDFWALRGYHSEGRRWLEALLALPGGTETGSGGREHNEAVERARLRILEGAAMFAFGQNDFARTIAVSEQALGLARELGEVGVAASVLRRLGRVQVELGETTRGRQLMEEAVTLARQSDDVLGRLSALTMLSSFFLTHGGDDHLAAVLAQEALDQAHVHHTALSEIVASNLLARIALRQGEDLRAEELGGEALKLAAAQGLMNWVPQCLETLALTAGHSARGERAAHLLGAAAVLRDTMGALPELLVRAEIEAMVLRGRAALGEAGWAAAYAAGQALSLEEAIAEALGERG